jgi:hypothetical protein
MKKSIFNLRAYAAAMCLAVIGFGGILSPVGAASVSGIVDKQYVAPGTGAVARTFANKAQERISVKDFGAKGDGVTDDAAAIQKALDFGGGDNGKQVYFPEGNYYISTSLKVSSFAYIVGAGSSKARINLQNKAYTGPVFVNATTDAFQFVTMRDLGVRGGSYGIYNTAATQEHLYLENMSFELQTQAGIYSAHDWQINSLVNVTFYYCFQGIVVNAGFANHNNYYHLEFLGITGASYKSLGSNEGNNFFGARFEAGGLNGNITIQVLNNRNMNFFGGYFENTHNTLLSETGGQGTTFEGVHFTGALNGSTPFEFSSDGEISFGANTWSVGSNGPAKMRITGNNNGMLGKNNKLIVASTKQNQEAVSASVTIPAAGATVPLMILSRVMTDASLNDMQSTFGFVTVIYRRVTTTGFDATYTAKIPVTINGLGGTAIGVTFGTPIIGANTVSETVVLSATALTNTGGTIQATIAGIPAGAGAFLSWSFDVTSAANPGSRQITTALP